MSFLLIPVMAAAAYILGSFSTAIIVSRWFGMDDPRTYGSGNPGASNMLRSGRKDAAAYTLAGDAVKGLLAVWVAFALRAAFDLGDGIVAVAAIAVVLGHMYPLFFNFKGGKGVATSLGVIVGMSLWTTFWVLAIWLTIAYKFKKSSLAALAAAACAPFLFFILEPHHPLMGWALMVIAGLVLYRHKDNIQRLREGRELLIGEPAQPLNQAAAAVETAAEAVAEKAEAVAEAAAEKAQEVAEAAAEKAQEVAEAAAAPADTENKSEKS